MKRIVKTVIIGALSLAAFSSVANAYPYHGWYGGPHHHRGGSGFSFSIGGPLYGPAPYPYARPPVIYTTPPPVIVQQPIMVNGPEVASDDGRYCREYQSKVTVGGRVEHSYGTACQQPDGSWEIVN